MSYDTYLDIYTGTEMVTVLEIGNYTSNVFPMWVDALNGRSLREYDGAPCSEAAGPLMRGVERMEEDPEKYKAMNPQNGWGNYEGALAYLRRIADACYLHPHCTIRISA